MNGMKFDDCQWIMNGVLMDCKWDDEMIDGFLVNY